MQEGPVSVTASEGASAAEAAMTPEEEQAIAQAFTVAGQVPDVPPEQAASSQQGAAQPTASQLAFGDHRGAAPGREEPDLTTSAGRALMAHYLSSGIIRDQNGVGPQVAVRDGAERERRTALNEERKREQAGPGGSGGSRVVGRSYRNYLDFARNDAEQRYLDALPEIVALTNQRLEAAGVQQRVTAAELATNFLAEGGTIALDTGQADNLSGFVHAGIDTLVDKRERVAPFAHDMVLDAMRTNASSHTNELGQSVTSIDRVSIETLGYANAAMYALMLQAFERDLRSRGIDPRTFPERGRVFWTCLYFNVGEGSFSANTGARKWLAIKGVNWYREQYRGRTGVANNRSAQNNATDRAASWELLAMDLDGPEQGGGNGLPTAPIGTVDVPLSQLARASDLIARDLCNIGLGTEPYSRAIGETIAIADMVNRVPGVPIEVLVPLGERRTLAADLAVFKYEIGAHFAFRGGPAFSNMSLAQARDWLVANPARTPNDLEGDRYIIDQIALINRYTQGMSENAFAPIEPFLQATQDAGR